MGICFVILLTFTINKFQSVSRSDAIRRVEFGVVDGTLGDQKRKERLTYRT